MSLKLTKICTCKCECAYLFFDLLQRRLLNGTFHWLLLDGLYHLLHHGNRNKNNTSMSHMVKTKVKA